MSQPLDIDKNAFVIELAGTRVVPANADADHDNYTRATELDGWRLYAVQFSLCFGLILSVMDSSVVATALVTIGRDFDNFFRITWVVLAYLLTYLGFALIFARTSDVVGRKWTTVAAFTILVAFSLGCGLSHTLNQLIAFRALQGVGGSGLYSMAMLTLPEITPRRLFPMMTGLIGIVFAVSAVLGPLLGGVIASHSTWRWVFLFNVPCGVFALIIIFVSWPHTQSPGRITLGQLDLVGCLLYLAASTLLIFALQEGGSGAYAWSSPTVISSLVFSGIASVLFVLWIAYLSRRERRIAPIFPARVITGRVMLVIVVTTTLVGFIFYTVLIELPERFQIINNSTPQSAGIRLLPMMCSSALGSGLGGFLSSKKKNRTFYTLTAANAFCLLGCGLLSSVSITRAIPNKLYGFEVLLGFGFGLTFSSATVATRLETSLKDAAPAQGLVAQSRILGGNIGLAIATIILNQRLALNLKGVLSTTQIDNLRRSLSAIETFTPKEAQAVVVVFGEAFQSQMRVCAYVAAASLVLCLLAWQRNPRTFQDTMDEEMEHRKRASALDVVVLGNCEAQLLPPSIHHFYDDGAVYTRGGQGIPSILAAARKLSEVLPVPLPVDLVKLSHVAFSSQRSSELRTAANYSAIAVLALSNHSKRALE